MAVSVFEVSMFVLFCHITRHKPWYLEECASTLATTYSSGTPLQDKSVATCDQDAALRDKHICTVSHTGITYQLLIFQYVYLIVFYYYSCFYYTIVLANPEALYKKYDNNNRLGFRTKCIIRSEGLNSSRIILYE